MVDRIPCINPDCSNTILPITAERNDGLCTPCVHAAADKAHKAFIEKNRRDLNEFEGITDPVEILKIIHKPRRYDPLLRWIPYPTPSDQLYTQLQTDEGNQLAEYARSMIGTDGHHQAEEILLCLAAFTDTPFDEALRALITNGTLWPSLVFKNSPEDVRDRLLELVEIDQENRRHLLSALAWIGDESVIARFEQWRCEPPVWRNQIRLPPHAFAHEGGWELNGQGKRRNLFAENCTALIMGNNTREQFSTTTAASEKCPWCDAALTHLVSLRSTDFGITSFPDKIQVTTCEICTVFGLVYGKFNAEGRGRWHPKTPRPDDLPDDSQNWERLPQNVLIPGEKRPAHFAANQFLPTTFSQIGGHPTWIQHSDYPHCPDCSETMMFLAQIDSGDIDDHSEGIYYTFVCGPCRTTATTYQQT